MRGIKYPDKINRATCVDGRTDICGQTDCMVSICMYVYISVNESLVRQHINTILVCYSRLYSYMYSTVILTKPLVTIYSIYSYLYNHTGFPLHQRYKGSTVLRSPSLLVLYL